MVTSIVCMKICVDTNQLKVVPETRAPNLKDAPLKINTFDENAIEEAVRIREKHGGKVIAITLAPFTPPREIILKALAMGVDTAYIVQDEACVDLDPLTTARILLAGIRKIGSFDLVICGESSSDQFNSQVGPRIAVELGIPSITYVTKLTINEGKVIAERALEDCVETVEAACPALVTVGQEINQPRLPPVLQIMGASKKPTIGWQLQDLGVSSEEVALEISLYRNLDVYAPPSERRRILVKGETVEDTAEMLARMLFEEGVVKR